MATASARSARSATYLADVADLADLADLKELRGWSDEEIQRILSSYQYKSKKVKLTSLGMYTARKKESKVS